MDSGKGMPSGVTVIAPGASSNYHVASRVENSPEVGASQLTPPPLMSVGSEKKKRGRPRKYRPDESSSSRGFSTVPISSSAPPSVPVARPINSEKKHKSKIGTEKLDHWIDCSTGSSFLPHVITVDPGEDIMTKIMEFARQGPRAVCIVSGSGTVSNVTIQHPNSSGGILTYEGLFEILSFSGSFTPTEASDSRFSRSGMMTITLSGADGRVVGGLISGLTTAATPVKVVVVSFLLGGPHELKPKKQQFTVDTSGPNLEHRSSSNMQGTNRSFNSENPNSHWAAAQTAENLRKSTADINISLHG